MFAQTSRTSTGKAGVHTDNALSLVLSLPYICSLLHGFNPRHYRFTVILLKPINDQGKVTSSGQPVFQPLLVTLTEGFSWVRLIPVNDALGRQIVSSMPTRSTCCIKVLDMESQRINKSFLYMEDLQKN